MGGTHWIDVAENGGRWRILVNVVVKLQVPQNAGNYFKISAKELRSVRYGG